MNRHIYTPAELAFLKAAYKKMNRRDTTAAFNEHFKLQLSEKQITACLKNHKFRSGRNNQFQKGNTSWNKGVRGYMGANDTSFKKGNRPHTWCPVGTERCESKDKYIKVKVGEPNKWKFKHILTWEKHRGPVPKGKVITFIDGDKTNCSDINNLQAIDRGTLAQFNKRGGSQLPSELQGVFRNVCAIRVTASRRQKEITNRKERNPT